ncbi:MAG: ATPase, T2SS/T4P/T4SS family [Candidatus ainarchaeum sp.]|nr:ATPase, T2SS/T4P/T4SS family [Candidatus ainarchaeum sp.]
MAIETKIEEMVALLKSKKTMSFGALARQLSVREDLIEKLALCMEKAGLAHLQYPINMIENPSITFIAPAREVTKEAHFGKLLSEYDITKDGNMIGHVKIFHSPEERRPLYIITLPEASPATRAYLDEVKLQVSKTLQVWSDDRNPEEDKHLFEGRQKLIADIIRKDLSPSPRILEQLSRLLLNEMYGLGELETLTEDKQLEEIVVNTARQPVSVYHKKLGWLRTNIMMKNEAETENFSQQIARKVGRQISTLNPILDAHLGTGERVNATLNPISAYGNTITMRLFAKNPWTIIHFVKKENNAMSLEMASLLWQAMHYEMNILTAGGTASGKTSALNALLALIPPFQRIVTIEDTRELYLPSYQWNWVPLVTRMPNPEGLGEVTMLDLMVNSLRMRPDRIILGEIRRKREAEVFFEAMHTGHSVYSTVHADTGQQVLKRLIEPPIEIPKSQVEDVHLLLVQYRDRRRNIRRTNEISEVISGVSGPELNRVFTWKPRTDAFESAKAPHRYMEELNMRTGMTEAEVNADQKDKASILSWMLKNSLEDVEDVGRVMKAYYSDISGIVAAAEKGTSPQKVL